MEDEVQGEADGPFHPSRGDTGGQGLLGVVQSTPDPCSCIVQKLPVLLCRWTLGERA